MGMRIGEGGAVVPGGIPPVPAGVVLQLTSDTWHVVDTNTRAGFGPLIAGGTDIFNARGEDPDTVISAYSYNSAFCYKSEAGELLQTGHFRPSAFHSPISIEDHEPYRMIFGNAVADLATKNPVQKKTKEEMLILIGYDEIRRRDVAVPEILKSLTKGIDPKKIPPRIARFDAAHSLDWSRQAGPDTAILIRNMLGFLIYYRHPDRQVRVYVDNKNAAFVRVAMRDRFILGEVKEVDDALLPLIPDNEQQAQTLQGLVDLIKDQPRGLFR